MNSHPLCEIYGTEGHNILPGIGPVMSCHVPPRIYLPPQVGLQTQSIPPELVKAAFGRSVEVSRMVAVEPRKRKFHEVVTYPVSPLLTPPAYLCVDPPALPAGEGECGHHQAALLRHR